MTTTRDSEAFTTGYEAHRQGELRSANPYPYRTWEGEQWTEGWDTSAGVTYGDLHDYATGDFIRPARKTERDESRRSGDEGVILVDGRRCYVEE